MAHRALLATVGASVAMVALGQSSDPSCTNATFPAAAWPAQHTRVETMFQPYIGPGPVWSRKPIWFDFPGLRYRADLFYLSGNENPLTTIYNSSSYWIGSKLSIITWPDARSLQNASCVQLDLGFGIMRPDWMVQGECRGDVWLSQKSDGTDPNYHRVSFTHIPVLSQDDGSFDWYSSYSGGAGFQMQAPGQSELDYVVNEETLLAAADFPPAGTPGPFDIPASAPTCIPVGSARTHSEALALVKAAGGSPGLLAALPEVRLARTMHRRAAAGKA